MYKKWIFFLVKNKLRNNKKSNMTNVKKILNCLHENNLVVKENAEREAGDALSVYCHTMRYEV